MGKKISITFLTLFIVSMFFLSCKKDKNDETTPTATTNSISGLVVDESNNPLTGVTVTAYGKTVTTSFDGSFVFSNVTVSNNRYIVNFSKTGYFDVSRSGDIAKGEDAEIVAGMISKTSSNSSSVIFLASTGGVLDLTARCKITFPANNFVVESTNAVYTGNVNVNACFIDPSTDDFSKFINGGDFKGKALDGKENALQMFSGLHIEITDDAGNKLQLNPNVKAPATVEFTIPSALLSFAPATVGVWGYDGATGQQTQSASASRNGDKVTSQIGHFSSWYINTGYTSFATVSGTVKDGNGTPVAGVKILVGQRSVRTNNIGKYTCKVPLGISINVRIPDYYGNTIAPQAITTAATNTVDFVVPTMKFVSGNLKNCTGQAVKGRLILIWTHGANNRYFSTVISKNDGTFSLPMNKSGLYAVIYAFGVNGATNSKSIPQDTSNTNIGTITLCPPVPLGTNKFTVSGGSLFTTPTTFNNFDQSFAAYNPTANSTFADVNGVDGGMYIHFNGKTGTYTINSNSTNVGFSIYLSSISTSISLESGTINVTRYDNVFGLIEGNFSGSGIIYPDTLTLISITNGMFSALREDDVSNNQPVKK